MLDDDIKKRPACLMKQFSSLEIVAVLLLLLLLLLAVDLEVEISRMPWLQMHTSSNKDPTLFQPSSSTWQNCQSGDSKSAISSWCQAPLQT